MKELFITRVQYVNLRAASVDHMFGWLAVWMHMQV